MAGPFQRTASEGPARLLTTTCRFDADLFARIEAEAERLGVSNSEVIRAYVREGLERRAAERAVGADLAEHEQRIARLERLVRALAAHRLPAGPPTTDRPTGANSTPRRPLPSRQRPRDGADC